MTRDSLGPVCGLGWGRGAAGRCGPRRQAAAATGALAPERWLLSGTRERDGEQQQVQERVEGALVGECDQWDPGFIAAALTSARGRHCERQGSSSARGAWRDSVLKARGENVPAPWRDTRP
jgi:hypothetical protein